MCESHKKTTTRNNAAASAANGKLEMGLPSLRDLVENPHIRTCWSYTWETIWEPMYDPM